MTWSVIDFPRKINPRCENDQFLPSDVNLFLLFFFSSIEPLLNGGQQTTSDSSSAASSNGTPSHSFKGKRYSIVSLRSVMSMLTLEFDFSITESCSQSSPSSDELPVLAAVQNGHPSKLPFATQISHSKDAANRTMMTDGRQLGLNNFPEHSVSSMNANFAQSPNEVSRMAMYNQSASVKSTANTSGFDNIPTDVSGIRPSDMFTATEDRTQSAFPEKYQQSTAQLPGAISSPTTSASSYFTKSTVPNAIDFTSDNILSKVSVSTKFIIRLVTRSNCRSSLGKYVDGSSNQSISAKERSNGPRSVAEYFKSDLQSNTANGE